MVLHRTTAPWGSAVDVVFAREDRIGKMAPHTRSGFFVGLSMLVMFGMFGLTFYYAYMLSNWG